MWVRPTSMELRSAKPVIGQSIRKMLAFGLRACFPAQQCAHQPCPERRSRGCMQSMRACAHALRHVASTSTTDEPTRLYSGAQRYDCSARAASRHCTGIRSDSGQGGVVDVSQASMRRPIPGNVTLCGDREGLSGSDVSISGLIKDRAGPHKNRGSEEPLWRYGDVEA